MAEGTMETRTIASLICTGANLSISATDLTRTILNSEDPFWVQYINRGGKVNADLFVPKTELEEFAKEMASYMMRDSKNGAAVYTPINFSVVEELNIPCPPDANGAKLEGKGFIHVFGPNKTPLMEGDNYVYQMDLEKAAELRQEYVTSLTGDLTEEQIDKDFEKNYGIDAKKQTTTSMDLAKIGDFYTTSYCRVVVPEGELKQGRDGIKFDDKGNPIYGKELYYAAESVALAHHGGVGITPPNWQIETDIAQIATMKETDANWVGKETRIITGLSFEDAKLLSRLAKENHVGFLMHQVKDTKDYAFETLASIAKSDQYAHTIAEFQILKAHPDFAEHMRLQQMDMTAVSDILHNTESINDASILLFTNDPSCSYVRITDVEREVANELHLEVTVCGLDEKGNLTSHVIDLQNDEHGYVDFVAAVESLKDFSIIRGDKACDLFENTVRSQGIDGLKERYANLYAADQEYKDLVSAVRKSVTENISKRDLTFGSNSELEVRIPDSDVIVSTIASSADANLTADEKMKALKDAIDKELPYMHVTPVSIHTSTPSSNLKSYGEFMIDDRLTEQESYRGVHTPWDIANFEESSLRGQKEFDRDQYEIEEGFRSMDLQDMSYDPQADHEADLAYMRDMAPNYEDGFSSETFDSYKPDASEYDAIEDHWRSMDGLENDEGWEEIDGEPEMERDWFSE